MVRGVLADGNKTKSEDSSHGGDLIFFGSIFFFPVELLHQASNCPDVTGVLLVQVLYCV